MLTHSRSLLLIGLTALVLACVLQRHVERRRIDTKLVWTDPAKKDSLESGFMALGGFRGLLADILWVRAIGQQDAGKFYELKLLCDMIQKLQPTFVQVHAFQAYNMSYNLAYRADTCEDKWYWIRSGLQTLENGLERNEHNHALWFELGYQYFDRLSDLKLKDKAANLDCSALRTAELPRIDDLSEAQRKHVFTQPDTWTKGRARNDENLRFAAYYFYQSLATDTEVNPVRTERIFGNCLDHLGHFRAKNVPIEKRKWDDWGSEDWWVEMMRRDKARGYLDEPSAPQNLQFTLCTEMHLSDKRMSAALTGNWHEEAAKHATDLNETYARYKKYFPNEKRSIEELLKDYRKLIQNNARYNQ